MELSRRNCLAVTGTALASGALSLVARADEGKNEGDTLYEKGQTMRTNQIHNYRWAMLVAVSCLLQALAVSALGQSAVKIHSTGSLIQQSSGLYALNLEGEASHLGLFTCFGEIDLVPGELEGEQDGTGVADFTAANGDHIVGVVVCHIGADDSINLHFSWRDSVEFSDGTIACSTGRFERFRPPGAGVICRKRCFVIDGVPVCYFECNNCGCPLG